MARNSADRREFLVTSMGALASGVIGTGALAQAASKRTASSVAGKHSNTHTEVRSDEEYARHFNEGRKFAEITAGRIAYIDSGSGPTALFLHGFPLNGFQWRGAIDQLSHQRRCVAPDFLGLGYTDVAPRQSITPSAQADMIAAFLDHLGIGQVDLIANDSGGVVAQLFTAHHPDRVRTLLLTNCDAETDGPPAAIQPVIEAARAGLYPDLWLLPWLRHKDVARSASGLGGLCYTHPTRPTDAALEQYLSPLVASAERKSWVNRYAVGLAPNPLAGIESRLRRCAVPTRIVWGMSDAIFSAHSPDYFAGILPELTGIRCLPEAKLFFPEEYPHIIAGEATLLWASA